MSAGRITVLGAALGVAAVVRYTVEIPSLTLTSETGLLWILFATMLRARWAGTPTPRHWMRELPHLPADHSPVPARSGR